MSNAKIKRWYIFPNYEYMIKHYTWIENKKFLLPVAWIMRIFKVLLKKNGNVKGNIAMNADKKQRDIYLEIYRKMDLKFK